jgi:cullin-associated NEDD8-dissociated protein 1
MRPLLYMKAIYLWVTWGYCQLVSYAALPPFALVVTGNPRQEEDLFGVICRDEEQTVTVRIGDSCPCRYPIRADGGTGKVTEIRTQNWCCGGNNHFDLNFWAFEQLAHPSYGVIPIEYRPVDCETERPLE